MKNKVLSIAGSVLALAGLIGVGAWASEQDNHRKNSEQILDLLQRDLREREIEAARKAKFEEMVQNCVDNTRNSKATCEKILK